MAPVDVNGREVMVGDLLRIFHFTTPRRRKVYLYKIVVRTSADRQIRPDGEFWYAVDTSEIATKGLADAWKHLIQPGDKFEIIDGLAIKNRDRSLTCWWERPKRG